MSDRDPKTGKFLKHHKVLSHRDPVTGRFISDSEFKYRNVVYEVDIFLRRAM